MSHTTAQMLLPIVKTPTLVSQKKTTLCICCNLKSKVSLVALFYVNLCFVFHRASNSLISFDDEQPTPSQAPSVSSMSSKMQALSKFQIL